MSEVFGKRLNTLDHKEKDARSAAIEKMGVHIDADMSINSMPVGHKQFTEIARELNKEWSAAAWRLVAQHAKRVT